KGTGGSKAPFHNLLREIVQGCPKRGHRGPVPFRTASLIRTSQPSVFVRPVPVNRLEFAAALEVRVGLTPFGEPIPKIREVRSMKSQGRVLRPVARLFAGQV